MKQKRQFAWTLGGAFLAVAALIAFFVVRSGSPGAVSAKGEGMEGSAGVRREKAQVGALEAPGATKPKRPASGQSEVSRRLLDLRDAGDKPAIHEEIAALAAAGRLVEAEPVLRTWCRAGEMELAQWALEFSARADASLHLVLCAEALSHRADVIREAALADLEQASGMRFEDSAQAFLWLSEIKAEVMRRGASSALRAAGGP